MKNIFNKNKNLGFTLVELIVVVGIIAVISALSIFNSSKLNSAVLISNTAYEIGLVIRDAQVSGLGSKVIQAGAGIATTSNQGVFFTVDSNSNDKIVFFADLNKDNTYQPGEESQIFNIENKRAGTVTKICQIESNGFCTQVYIYNLTIMFKRPNPEAYFYPDISPPFPPHTGEGYVLGYSGNVAVNVGFDGGDCRSIIIYKTGAIQIDRSYCSPVVN